MGIENKLSGEKMDSTNNLSASKLKTWASQAVLVVKNMPANAGWMWEGQVRSLSWEDPLEDGMATHSSILAWRIPWTEESGT